MRARRRISLASLAMVVAAATAGALAVAEPSQAAAPPARSSDWIALRAPAVVTLGDSYISGEAGRWKGNSPDPSPGHAGTDRAFQDGTTDSTRIYGPTAGSCDRSDVAPVISARIPFAKPINLACSGAKTQNVLRAASGGVSYQGEAPQNDQLAAVAAQYRVRLISVSIGGNDLGFFPILQTCIAAYLFSTTPCSSTQQAAIDQGLPQVQAKVAAVLQDVRATMTAAGYAPGDYQLVLQSYPSPLASAADFRYPQAGPRASAGGCPFYDADADWAGKTLIPQLKDALAAAAGSAGAQLLDLSDAFAGHQLCSAQDEQSTGTPSAWSNEWVRFIDLTGQGTLSESLHPNYYGQQALGRCLALTGLTGLAPFLRGTLACHGSPGLPPQAVYLSRA